MSTTEQMMALIEREIHPIIAERNELEAALRLFVEQWNACGPNSDFGRYFANVRDVAVAALAKVQS